MDEYNKWLKEFKEITEMLEKSKLYPPRAKARQSVGVTIYHLNLYIISLDDGLYLINDSKNYLVITKEDNNIR